MSVSLRFSQINILTVKPIRPHFSVGPLMAQKGFQAGLILKILCFQQKKLKFLNKIGAHDLKALARVLIP